MTMKARLKVGEKVATRISMPGIPAGAVGIVVYAYRSMLNRYTVQFETSSAFMWGYDLDRAKTPPR
jgi:hypothetical protein